MAILDATKQLLIVPSLALSIKIEITLTLSSRILKLILKIM